MALKKIMIKKGATLTGLVFTIILALGIFTGLFLYLQKSAELSGVTIDEKYNQTYANLTDASNDLDNNIKEIQDSYAGIREATTGFFSWNGMRLLGNTLKLPISLLTTSLATYTSINYSIDYVPTWAKTLIVIGITAFIIFLVLAVLRGRS